MVAPRREDAANQRVALAFLASGDWQRARGWARLLICDGARWELMTVIGQADGAGEAMAATIAEDRKYVAEQAKRGWKGRKS